MKKQFTSMNDEEVMKLNKQLKKKKYLTSSLNIPRYLESRMKDINQLERSLQGKYGNKRVFQQLPRHRRRRAMSHNIHLLPKHLRHFGEIEMNKIPGRVIQRHRRKKKRRFLTKESYLHGLDCTNPNVELHVKSEEEEKMKEQKNWKGKRMVTHIFHAKRMKMMKIWNFFIAWKSNQKVFRVSYRFRRQHATIYDTSYLICCQLSGKKNDIINILNEFKISRMLRNTSYTTGERELNGIMYSSKENTKGKVLSIVKIQWNQDQNSWINPELWNCWVWIHPSSLPNSWNELKEVCDKKKNVILKYRNDLCRFEIRGKYNTQVLKRKTVLLLDQNQNSGKLKAWNMIENAGYIPQNMIISLRIRHPLAPITPDLNIINMDIQKNKEKKLNEEIENEDDFGAPFGLSNSIKVEEEFDEKFLTIPSFLSVEEGSNTLFPKSTLVKNDKINGGDNDDVIMEDKKKSEKKVEEEKRKKMFSIFLVQQTDGMCSNDFGSGWDIICSNEIGLHLFPKIAKSKSVLPLSLVDRNRLNTEIGLLNFPDDYPNSLAFLNQTCQIQEVYKQKKKNIKDKYKWDDLPKFRIYQKMDELITSSTSIIKDKNIRELTRTEILCSWGGTPVIGANLVLVKDQDEFISVEKDPKAIIKNKSDNRSIVGFVTTGIRSLKRGKGFGVCFVDNRIIMKIPKKKIYNSFIG